MGSFSPIHWLVVLAVILILFAAGRLPRMMGDLAKGIKSFRAGMKDDDEDLVSAPAKLEDAAGRGCGGTGDLPRQASARPT